jgi:hypothetical protein
MNRKTILTGIAAFATTMAFGLAAQADEYIFTGAGSDWNTATNWYNNTSGSVNGFPNDAEDVALFNAGLGTPNPASVTLSTNVVVGHVEVRNSTAVAISASSRLELGITDGSATDGLLVIRDASSSMSLGAYVTLALNSAVTHQVAGVIAMTSQTNDAIIEVNANVEFGPFNSTYGLIKGEDAGAQIQIVASATLKNKISIEGMLEILPQSGTATFVNRRDAASAASGLVHANAAGVLKLNSSLILGEESYDSGTTAPLWAVSSNASARLEFNRASAFTFSEFSDANCPAELRMNANVSTGAGRWILHTGRFNPAGGTFTVGSTVYSTLDPVNCP